MRNGTPAFLKSSAREALEDPRTISVLFTMITCVLLAPERILKQFYRLLQIPPSFYTPANKVFHMGVNMRIFFLSQEQMWGLRL